MYVTSVRRTFSSSYKSNENCYQFYEKNFFFFPSTYLTRFVLKCQSFLIIYFNNNEIYKNNESLTLLYSSEIYSNTPSSLYKILVPNYLVPTLAGCVSEAQRRRKQELAATATEMKGSQTLLLMEMTHKALLNVQCGNGATILGAKLDPSIHCKLALLFYFLIRNA